MASIFFRCWVANSHQAFVLLALMFESSLPLLSSEKVLMHANYRLFEPLNLLPRITLCCCVTNGITVHVCNLRPKQLCRAGIYPAVDVLHQLPQAFATRRDSDQVFA